MNLERMRLILGRYLGLEGGLDPTDADSALNVNHQFALPNLIGGAILEGYIDIVTVASTGDYNFDVAGLAMASPVISKNVFRPVINTANGNFLRVSDQPIEFWGWNDQSSTSEGEPLDALIRGRSVTFRPIPDAVYTVRVYGQVYRAALTAAGIADEEEATLICAMAGLDMGEQYGRDQTIARAQKAYDRHYPLVWAKYRARSSTAMTQTKADGHVPAERF